MRIGRCWGSSQLGYSVTPDASIPAAGFFLSMLNVSLIGYGYWGPNLARNFADADGVTLTAVADSRPDRCKAAERRHPGAVTCADASALIARADVDAVVIATPLNTHF